MQNFMGLCRNLIAFSVQTQLPGEDRHCYAEVNLVRRLDEPSFQFGHQNDSASRLLLQSLPRADLGRQQICGGADEVRSL